MHTRSVFGLFLVRLSTYIGSQLFFIGSGVPYAAKRFYNIGANRDPSEDEITAHLQEEMLRLDTVSVAVSKFTQTARAKKLPVHSEYLSHDIFN